MIGAIEAGGTKFVVALAAPDGSVIERARIATTTPDETFAAVRSFFDRASAEHGALTSIGIASFGPIELSPASADYGTITSTPKPGWTHRCPAGRGAGAHSGARPVRRCRVSRAAA